MTGRAIVTNEKRDELIADISYRMKRIPGLAHLLPGLELDTQPTNALTNWHTFVSKMPLKQIEEDTNEPTN